ncbi:5-deoxyglucuronate isomerase [Clostridium tetani]|uniref:5-deoxy-glucuronate isomerase n=1 Tax=Clostridium tetani TaxID=1513 RepID=UPI00100B6F77|nr:5-deoxy-glucuronate isomerase [Clostridium tetani]RXI47714.1 5-deoxyglucuronate isomerase [Clostridium tetani]RXM60132.1 5-deoxyglucuronate isomerase [Clostridium tetani]RXM66376.1 5-deoxyglucuronate isomerase [Clostridium tetani]
MLEKLKELEKGHNILVESNGKHSEMMMDISICKLETGQEEFFIEKNKESSFLLLLGKVLIKWEDKEQEIERNSLFDEDPWCLHVPKGVNVKITALTDAEVLVQKTENSRVFLCKLYSPKECRSYVFGNGVWNDTGRRVVRTVFDYSNAPYSNMVMGEVITYPGKWSSYIPHHHPQPEVYYYRFNKPQGFGCAFIGEEAYKITDNSIATIPGGLVHPQTSAPGYAMYYCWMIRHLENNPWTDRINEREHEWLLESDVKIWPEK